MNIFKQYSMIAIMMIAILTILVSAVAGEVITTDVEVRGEIISLDNVSNEINDTTWTAYNFAGYWYDLDADLQTEKLWIADGTINDSINDRTIGESELHYTTSAIWQEYELHENEGLTVKSNNAGGDDGYWIEGWMAEEYVAIDNNSNKLSKLLVEFEGDDKKTLSIGEEWYLGGGFSLTADQIDLDGSKVMLTLKKNGADLDTEIVSTGSASDRVYTYTADIGGEDDIPIFSCYVDAVFRGTESNLAQIMYVFLIEDEIIEINSGDTYGVMEVVTASKSGISLTNKDSAIDLGTGTEELIMGSMYFKTADDDAVIRFYPFVKYSVDAPEEVVCPELEPCPPCNATPCPVITPEVIIEYINVSVPAEATPAAKKYTPGFEAVFALAGLLGVAYLVLKQRK